MSLGDLTVKSLQIGAQVVLDRQANLCVQDGTIQGDVTIQGNIIGNVTCNAIDTTEIVCVDATFAGGVESLVDVSGAMPALNPDKLLSLITTTQVSTGSLPNGTIEGQLKAVTMLSFGGNFTLSGSIESGPVVFSSRGYSVYYTWLQGSWKKIGGE